ncbi:hypothetical protein JCM14124_28340 [Humidesulfovibrio idahonensis]
MPIWLSFQIMALPMKPAPPVTMYMSRLLDGYARPKVAGPVPAPRGMLMGTLYPSRSQADWQPPMRTRRRLKHSGAHRVAKPADITYICFKGRIFSVVGLIPSPIT